MLAKRFQIGNRRLRVVVFQFSVRVDLPQPLVELDDVERTRVEVLTVRWLPATPGPPWITTTGMPLGFPLCSHAIV